jgi:ribonuclease PH
MSSAERSRSRIGGEIIMAVRREDRGIDVRIAVAPEADTVTPDGVIVDIVDGEWSEQRSDPTISAVDVSPPPDVTAMPARQRCSRDDLPACRRAAEPGIHRVVGALRSEGSRPDLAVTGNGTRVM